MDEKETRNHPDGVNKITTEEQKDGLFSLLATLRGEDEFRRLFEDMCTYNEIEQMAQRLAAARLLIEGATYNRVMARTGISSATLSRVSRCIQRGSGGYAELLRRGADD